MKSFFTTLIISLTIYSAEAQCDGRYETPIFTTVSVNTVNYSDVYTGLEHEMDIYTADGDTTKNRPVIFFMHGGSFYQGDKGSSDCVDFCKNFARRGYVTISANYRLSTIAKFVNNTDVQFKTVLRAIADIKSAIRYMRKDFENGNNYGIDTNTIFVGGYSAGAVLAIHLAYIDRISELPTSPVNVQMLVDSIGGTLEGDAGNDGYSSAISGVISFAGGINDENLIDSLDEPIYAVHGTDDSTVAFNCRPALGIPSLLTLCGANVFHPKALSVGINSDTLVLHGVGHGWAALGSLNPDFKMALDSTSSFIHKLLPCYKSDTGSTGGSTFVNTIFSSEVSIYPNPASNVLNVITKESIDFKIFDVKGNLLINKNINSNEVIDLDGFTSGLYFIQTKNSSFVINNQKLIIE